MRINDQRREGYDEGDSLGFVMIRNDGNAKAGACNDGLGTWFGRLVVFVWYISGIVCLGCGSGAPGAVHSK